MSILLDISLFMINSKTKLGLSLANEGVLNKLATRVGSNATTWVSHERLAQDCGIAPKNLTEHVKKLVKSKLIKISKLKGDKRRNSYSFASSIYNYHKMDDLEKENTHKKFNDELWITQKNRLQKRNVNSRDRLQKRNLNTLPKRNLSLNSKTSKSTDTHDLAGFEKPPKGSYENKNKSKDRRSFSFLKNKNKKLTQRKQDDLIEENHQKKQDGRRVGQKAISEIIKNLKPRINFG